MTPKEPTPTQLKPLGENEQKLLQYSEKQSLPLNSLISRILFQVQLHGVITEPLEGDFFEIIDGVVDKVIHDESKELEELRDLLAELHAFRQEHPMEGFRPQVTFDEKGRTLVNSGGTRVNEQGEVVHIEPARMAELYPTLQDTELDPNPRAIRSTD